MEINTKKTTTIKFNKEEIKNILLNYLKSNNDIKNNDIKNVEPDNVFLKDITKTIIELSGDVNDGYHIAYFDGIELKIQM
jgi:hypothetical protein